MPATRSQTRRGGGRKAAAAPRRRAAVAAAQAPASHKKRSSQGQEPELQGAQTRSKKKRLEASEPPPSQGRGRGGAGSAAHECIAINRAPVLNLWVAVVAQRQGYSFEEGLTFGRWVSGTLAQSKGRSLGIFEAKEVSEEEKAAKRRRDEALGVRRLDVFGMHVPSVECDGRQVAVSQGKPIDPSGTEAYLQRAFGAAPLAAARAAVDRAQVKYSGQVVTECEMIGNYTPAEEEHQQYLEKGGRFNRPQSAAKRCNDPIRCYG